MSDQYDERQVMLTLSYIAYTGFYSIVPSDAPYIRAWIERWLSILEPVKDQWDLVWGPAVFRFPPTLLSDNVMYVVRHRQDRQRYVVVIRGTNPLSWSNWLFEDFLVRKQIPWRLTPVPSDLDARVSLGTWIGIRVLRSLRANQRTSGERLRLQEFLARELDAAPAHENVRITVTGHSLGGALSPPLALWLHDTRGTAGIPDSEMWDPECRADISVVPFAGPTPGNADFARLFDNRLGARCDRVVNDLDIATFAWDTDLLRRLESLYKPVASMPTFLRWIRSWTERAVSDRTYAHVRADQAPLSGTLHKGLGPLYLPQAVYQHSVAYLELLGLTDILSASRLLEFLPVLTPFLSAHEDSALRPTKRAGARFGRGLGQWTFKPPPLPKT